MKYYLLCALVMALASYIPRFVPLVIFRKKIKSNFIKSFLYYMPYAVLSALTLPAILYSTGNVYTGIIGTVLAIILSFFKLNLAIVALICVAVSFGFGFLL